MGPIVIFSQVPINKTEVLLCQHKLKTSTYSISGKLIKHLRAPLDDNIIMRKLLIKLSPSFRSMLIKLRLEFAVMQAFLS